jgi:hypothetical protein
MYSKSDESDGLLAPVLNATVNLEELVRARIHSKNSFGRHGNTFDFESNYSMRILISGILK